MEKTLRRLAINYGLYTGLILAAATIIGYTINLELLTKFWLGILLFLVILILGIVSVAKVKSLLKGFVSFKQAFTTWFLTIVVGVLISTIVNVVLFNFIDPEAAEIIKQAGIDTSISMMESFGAPQEAIDEAVKKMEAEDNMFSIGRLLKSLVWQFLFYAIIGLIVAAIMKKKDPDAA